MMLALLLAFSISSPKIGTFFDLPGWMPTEVPSDRTFGSDDATNMTHRVDDVALAAVNAVFEGWCERCYFSNEGGRNVWDEGTYGPDGYDLPAIRFGMPGYPYPSPGFVYSPDTNRTAETRRLVEYDNLDRLATALMSSPRTWMSRPRWGGTEYLSLAQWSSTLLEPEGAGTPNRTVAWKPPYQFLGSFTPDQWARSAMTWAALKYDEWAPVNWSTDATYNPLAADMVRAVQWGEPPFTTSGVYPVPPRYIPNPWQDPTNTTMDVVGHGHAVTNVVEEHVRSYVEVGLGDPNPYSGGIDTMKEQLEDEIAFYISSYTSYTNSFSGTVYFRNWANLSYDVNGETVTCIYPWLNFSLEYPDGHHGVASGIMFDSVDITCPGLARESDINYVDIFPNGTGGVGFPFSYDADTGEVAVDGDGEIADVEVWYDKSAVTYRAGVDGITNDTRRLVTDRLAGLGIGLSALDRTYYDTPVRWADMTNVTWTSSGSASGEAEITMNGWWFEPGVGARSMLDEQTIPELEEDSHTNAVSASSEGHPSSCVVRVTPVEPMASTGITADPLLTASNAVWIADSSVLVDAVNAVHWSHPDAGADRAYFYLGMATLTYAGVVGNKLVGTLTTTYNEYKQLTPQTQQRVWQGTISFPVEAELPDVLPCLVTAYAQRSYTWSRTLGGLIDWTDEDLLHPGRLGFSNRMFDYACVWTAASAACSVGNRQTPWPYPYPSYSESPYYTQSFESDYALMSDEFTSKAGRASALLSQASSVHAECERMLRSAFPHYDDQLVMADYNEAGVFDAFRSSLRIGWNTDVIATFGEGYDSGCPYDTFEFLLGAGATLTRATLNDRSHTWTTPSFPFVLTGLKFSFSKDPEGDYSPPGRYGAAANGKMSTCTRVDWNWKALKRERNNQ